MYGLLIDSIRQLIVTRHSEDKWVGIMRHADIEAFSFGVHDTYSETLIPRIITAASELLDMTEDELFFDCGVQFIRYIKDCGYANILKVLGRDLKDFLNGLDNLHEYLRFTYPKMKAPSFYCVNESKTGITIQYRSKRRGYREYVRGQLTEAAKTLYELDVVSELISESSDEQTNTTIIRLHFDNSTYRRRKTNGKYFEEEDNLPVPSEVFFEVFPFHIVYNRGMVILSSGSGLKNALPDLDGSELGDSFLLVRPYTKFNWDGMMMHLNNVFEIIAISSLNEEQKEELLLSRRKHGREARPTSNKRSSSIMANTESLRLRGQMKYMSDWDAIIFLGVPILRNITALQTSGLYINDLSMHDSSRDLVLAGEQQSAELRLALDQEHEKSQRLEDSLHKLDVEMRRTDELLYQMIPKSVAQKLRRGEDVLSTCQTFEEVTILFSDVVGFTNICSEISPLEVVSMLNSMYSLFDELTEKHSVYKVETIGDAYMIVSGAPTPTDYHAAYICEMALDMVKSIIKIRDPSKSLSSLQIRVGAHTGTVVAGVVGQKMPRYCLFGDSVNTASRMESNSAPQKIHISESVRQKIEHFPYVIRDRSTIEVKGKGIMKTFWLEGHRGHDDDPEVESLQEILRMDRNKLFNGDSRQPQGHSFINDDASSQSSITNQLQLSRRRNTEIPPLAPNSQRPSSRHRRREIMQNSDSKSKTTLLPNTETRYDMYGSTIQ